MSNGRLQLECGRSLAYAQFGARAGIPVIYCHGFPGSRIEAGIAHQTASSLGIRIVAIDRPGLGESESAPGRTILGWADDVQALADHLELGEFHVLGVSGGAPYALACALRLSRRIRSVAIVSGHGPPESVNDTSATSTSGLGLRVVGKFPRAAPVVSSVLGVVVRYAPPVLFALLRARGSPLDRRTLDDDAFRSVLRASLREAFRHGASGAATDLRLLCASWGFEPKRLNVPVHIWHGEADRIVPASMGRYLERSLPNCQATYLEAHGHYSLVHDCTQRILSRLIE